MSILFFIYLWYFKTTNYIFSQAYHQFKILYYSKPLEEYLHLADIKYKKQIHLVFEIKKFAVNKLGLKGKSYKTMFDQKGKPVLWNIVASAPFSFEEKKWNFPFIGSFPYKGFFVYEDAISELSELKQQGYDTRIYEVEAWSTLGWFNDPLLSNMLQESEGELANTIIHEFTHSTLFHSDSSEWNENMATFIGDEGAKEFLIQKYGNNSAQVIDYLKQIADEKKKINFILNGYKRLEKFYNSKFFRNSGTTEKKRMKDSLISQIQENAHKIIFFTNTYKFPDNWKPNNAYFVLYKNYHSKQDDFRKIMLERFNGNLSLFIKDEIRKFSDPE